MSKCKGTNSNANYYQGSKPCTRIIVNDKYKNGYCFNHQDQATKILIPTAAPLPQVSKVKIIYQMPESDDDDESFATSEQEKVLTELSAWMPNEKERVLAAAQLVLDKC